MRKYILLIILVIIILATGCQSASIESESIRYEKEISELKSVNNSLESEIIELRSSNEKLELNINELNRIPFYEYSVADYSNGFIRFIEKVEKEPISFTLSLIGYNREFYDESYDVIDYSGDNIATVKFKVFGYLYNFKIAKVDWNESFTSYEELEIVCELDEIRNKSVQFDSVLAEGYPSEVLTWENEKGESFSYLIGADGYGFSALVLICEEYSQ